MLRIPVMKIAVGLWLSARSYGGWLWSRQCHHLGRTWRWGTHGGSCSGESLRDAGPIEGASRGTQRGKIRTPWRGGSWKNKGKKVCLFHGL